MLRNKIDFMSNYSQTNFKPDFVKSNEFGLEEDFSMNLRIEDNESYMEGEENACLNMLA